MKRGRERECVNARERKCKCVRKRERERVYVGGEIMCERM